MSRSRAPLADACDYCGRGHLAYTLESDRGTKHRCIPCLAIEQGQQKLGLPLSSFDSTEDDLLESSYDGAREWFVILARLVEDKPVLKRDDAQFGKLSTDRRTFLENIMGDDAFEKPSVVAGQPEGIEVAQQTFASLTESDEETEDDE